MKTLSFNYEHHVRHKCSDTYSDSATVLKHGEVEGHCMEYLLRYYCWRPWAYLSDDEDNSSDKKKTSLSDD